MVAQRFYKYLAAELAEAVGSAWKVSRTRSPVASSVVSLPLRLCRGQILLDPSSEISCAISDRHRLEVGSLWYSIWYFRRPLVT